MGVKKGIVLLTLVGLLTYFPSLFGNFVWDDEDFVYANKYVEEGRIDKFFTSSVTEGRGKSSNYYRPIQSTVYSLVHSAFGFSPFHFHLVNIIVHIIAACLVYYFLHLLTANRYPLAVFLTTLFFLIHPVQTEAVSFISGLSDPLMVAFFFLTLIFYLKKQESRKFLYLSVISLVLTLLSKESGLVVLPVLLLLEILLRPKEIKRDLPILLLYIAIGAFYLLLRFTLLQFADMSVLWGGSLYGGSLAVRIATFFQNFFTYLGLLVFPRDLFMERDYSTTIVSSLVNPWSLAFILFNSAVPLLLFRFLKSSYALFFYLSFLAAFFPFSGIVLINGIFYEHFLYLPLVFFFASILFLLGTNLDRKIIKVIIFIIFMAFIARSYLRQYDWIDNVRFYKQTLERAPQSVRVINNLGMAHAEKNELNEATSVYEQGIEINPKVPNLYHNLANVYQAQGKFAEAEKNYLQAINADPNFRFSYFSLLNLYLQTNQKEKAEKISSFLPR